MTLERFLSLRLPWSSMSDRRDTVEGSASNAQAKQAHVWHPHGVRRTLKISQLARTLRYPPALWSLSFSQAGEDRIVRWIFEVRGVTHPTYMDLGAYHPFELSNTALMHIGGSTGVNVEPNPTLFSKFCRARKCDTNLNVGVAAHPGVLTFFHMSIPTMSTFSRRAAETAEQESGGRIRVVDERPVRVVDAPSLMSHFGVPDFLSIDIEGHDAEVLHSLPGWPDAPRVICVETVSYTESGIAPRNMKIYSTLERADYIGLAETPVNTIFVLKEWWSSRG